MPGQQQPPGAREDLGRQRSGRPAWAESLLSGIGPLLGALIVLCVVLSFATDKFLTTSNLLNVLVQMSVVGIAAVGGTFVIITSGIDLSVGSTSPCRGWWRPTR